MKLSMPRTVHTERRDIRFASLHGMSSDTPESGAACCFRERERKLEPGVKFKNILLPGRTCCLRHVACTFITLEDKLDDLH